MPSCRSAKWSAQLPMHLPLVGPQPRKLASHTSDSFACIRSRGYVGPKQEDVSRRLIRLKLRGETCSKKYSVSI
jgi:hypothetical protein